MKGDFTRFTFDPKKHYSSVRMQQGRVQLDADWNEQIDITAHRIETESADVIGLSGAPKADAGFQITADKDKIVIGKGRYYVDGILCENEADVDFTAQPDLPGQVLPKPEEHGIYLAYLDVWQHHITTIEDPAIREVALGGPDTTTRTKTVWQVKLLRVGEVGASIHCLSELKAWKSLIAPGRGSLLARSNKPEASSTDPNTLSPEAGYRRMENQLYRVEIHKRGQDGQATFKWSRDNGSVASRVETIDAPYKIITVADPGKDALLRFVPGQWVELSDAGSVLRGEPGMLLQLDRVEGKQLWVKEWPDGSAPTVEKNEKWVVRRWDSPGDIAVKVTDTNDGWVPLGEDGVEVKFEEGSYHTGDYWLIPARTITGDVEWPRDGSNAPLAQPPHGIQHHYCRLGLLTRDNKGFKVIGDCRQLFPPVTKLTALYYVSGDGQEAMPAQMLPQPLKVGVANGQLPVEGTSVKFRVVTGNGKVATDEGALQTADESAAEVIVETGSDGVAKCYWQLDAANQSQQVEAALLDDAGDPVHVPVLFNANQSVATDVYYPPQGRGRDNPDLMGGVQTVQEGLDRLDEVKLNRKGPDTMTGPLTIDQDLTVSGKLTVRGEMIVRDVEHQPGDMQFGDHDEDQITIHGELRSAHSSDALEVDDALHVTGSLNVDGNVGIGTLSPQQKLDVSGGLRIGDVASGNKYTEIRTTPQDNVIQFFNSEGTALWEVRDDNSTLKINEGNNTNNRLTISSGGKVGIGTASPAEKLHVDGNLQVDEALRVKGPLTADGNVGIGMATPAGKLHVSGGDAVFDGNVGIGTTSPQDALHVKGVAARIEAAADYSPTLRFINSDGATTQGIIQASSNFEIQNNRAGRMDFYTAASDHNPQLRVSIDQNGKVGIGTPNPGAKLDIHGDIKLQRGVAIHEISTDETFLDNSDTAVPTEKAVKTFIDNLELAGVSRKIHQVNHGFSVGQAIYYNSEAGAYELARSDQDTTTGLFLVSKVKDENNFVLTQAGYISGLGGLRPGEYYYVSDKEAGALVPDEPIGGISNPILYADSETSGYVLPYRPSEVAPGENVLKADPYAPPSSIYVNQKGDVGIGTTSPQDALHVKGVARIEAAAGYGSALRFIDSDGATTQGIIQAGGNFEIQNNQAGRMDFYTAASDGNPQLRVSIDQNGNVGIGTPSPAGKLQVSGGDATFDGKVGIGTTSPSALLSVTGGGVGGYRQVYVTGTATGGGITLQASGGVPWSLIATGASASQGANKLLLYQDQSDKYSATMTLDNAGNVGIGTTNPSGRLHIVAADLPNLGGSLRQQDDNFNPRPTGIRFEFGGKVYEIVFDGRYYQDTELGVGDVLCNGYAGWACPLGIMRIK